MECSFEPPIQLHGSRVYSPYPYDYIFCQGSKEELKKEYNSFDRGFYKSYHDDYVRIHKGIFNRNDIGDLIKDDLSKVNNTKKEVIMKLDTYSIGILIPTIFCDIADHYKVPNKKIYKCFFIRFT